MTQLEASQYGPVAALGGRRSPQQQVQLAPLKPEDTRVIEQGSTPRQLGRDSKRISLPAATRQLIINPQGKLKNILLKRITQIGKKRSFFSFVC